MTGHGPASQERLGFRREDVRHIVRTFRDEGADNVSWVWCPNASAFNAAAGSGTGAGGLAHEVPARLGGVAFERTASSSALGRGVARKRREHLLHQACPPW